MAGINFKDIALLTYGDIDNGRIYYARRKTGKMMNCCLTEQAQEIIDKYHTDQVEEDYLFPILDRQIHTTEKQILERVKKTLKHVNKLSITSIVRGGHPIWSSAKGAASAKATRLPSSMPVTR